MSKQYIRIERLEIKLRRIAPETARRAVNDLGRHLLDHLAAENLTGNSRTVRIARIEPAALRVAAGTGPNELRTALRNSIANSIRAKLR